MGWMPPKGFELLDPIELAPEPAAPTTGWKPPKGFEMVAPDLKQAFAEETDPLAKQVISQAFPGARAGPDLTEFISGVRDQAKALGMLPEHYLTGLLYESPELEQGNYWQAGPRTKWGQHRGAFQWGEPQAAEYGVGPDVPISEQLAAGTRYLLDRGFKPGSNLLDFYSTINAGAPGLYNRSDRPGETVESHVQRMLQERLPTAMRLLQDYPEQAPMDMAEDGRAWQPPKGWQQVYDPKAVEQSLTPQEQRIVAYHRGNLKAPGKLDGQPVTVYSVGVEVLDGPFKGKFVSVPGYFDGKVHENPKDAYEHWKGEIDQGLWPVYDSGAALNARSKEIHSIMDAETPKPAQQADVGFGERMGNAFTQGLNLTGQALNNARLIVGQADNKTLAQAIADQNNTGYFTSPDLQAMHQRVADVAKPSQGAWGRGDYWESIKGLGDTAWALGAEFVDDPTLAAEFAAQSFGTSAVPMGGMMAGGVVGGPIGMMAGGFTGSAVLEFGLWLQSAVSQEVEKAGLDPKSAQDVEEVLNRPGVRAALQKEAATKGLTHAAIGLVFDRLTHGMMRMAPPGMAGKLVQGGISYGMQTASEGAEEMGSQIAAHGDYDVSDVAQEMLGSGVSSAVQTGLISQVEKGARAAKKGYVRGKLQKKINRVAGGIEEGFEPDATYVPGTPPPPPETLQDRIDRFIPPPGWQVVGTDGAGQPPGGGGPAPTPPAPTDTTGGATATPDVAVSGQKSKTARELQQRIATADHLPQAKIDALVEADKEILGYPEKDPEWAAKQRNVSRETLGDPSVLDVDFKGKVARFGDGKTQVRVLREGANFVEVEQVDSGKTARVSRELWDEATAERRAAQARSLRDLIDRPEATAEEIYNHPAVIEEAKRQKLRTPTEAAETYLSPEWRAYRKLQFDQEQVVGYRKGLDRWEEKAKSFAPKIEQGKRAVVVIGAPGAGKSTVVEKMLAKARAAAVLDADMIKENMPEFEGGRGTSAVHGESSWLFAKLAERFIERGDNVVIPRTAGVSGGAVRRMINRLKQAGYEVDLVNVDVNENEAAKRQMKRWLDKGRFTSPDFTRGGSERAKRLYKELRDEKVANRYAEIDANESFKYKLGQDGEAVSDIADIGRGGGAGVSGRRMEPAGRAKTPQEQAQQRLKAIENRLDRIETQLAKRGAKKRLQRLKAQWARINDRLLGYLSKPNSRQAKYATAELEAIVDKMHDMQDRIGGPRDVVIVGSGPSGLSAAINGGAEGLNTLLIGANKVPGGQAKHSSRIENFPGFPIGVTGAQLTASMFEQAKRLGVKAEMGVRVTGMSHDAKTGIKTLTLSDGRKVEARTVILAGGLSFRNLKFEGSEGPGVIVGDGAALTAAAEGGNAIVIGGSNGAAQAALGAAQKAKHVTILARSPIVDSMSDYQVSAVRNHPKITVLEGDQITALARDKDGNPTEATTKNGKKIPVKAVGVFIGSAPNTAWLPAEIAQEKGQVKTGPDYTTSMPGVFAVGDIRAGGEGRVAAAAGEGQKALKRVFRALEEQAAQQGKPLFSGVKRKQEQKPAEKKPEPDRGKGFIKGGRRYGDLSKVVSGRGRYKPLFSGVKQKPSVQSIMKRASALFVKAGELSGDAKYEPGFQVEWGQSKVEAAVKAVGGESYDAIYKYLKNESGWADQHVAAMASAIFDATTADQGPSTKQVTESAANGMHPGITFTGLAEPSTAPGEWSVVESGPHGDLNIGHQVWINGHLVIEKPASGGDYAVYWSEKGTAWNGQTPTKGYKEDFGIFEEADAYAAKLWEQYSKGEEAPAKTLSAGLPEWNGAYLDSAWREKFANDMVAKYGLNEEQRKKLHSFTSLSWGPWKEGAKPNSFWAIDHAGRVGWAYPQLNPGNPIWVGVPDVKKIAEDFIAALETSMPTEAAMQEPKATVGPPFWVNSWASYFADTWAEDLGLPADGNGAIYDVAQTYAAGDLKGSPTTIEGMAANLVKKAKLPDDKAKTVALAIISGFAAKKKQQAAKAVAWHAANTQFPGNNYVMTATAGGHTLQVVQPSSGDEYKAGYYKGGVIKDSHYNYIGWFSSPAKAMEAAENIATQFATATPTYSAPEDHPDYQQVYDDIYTELYDQAAADARSNYGPQMDDGEIEEPDQDWLWERAKEYVQHEEGGTEMLDAAFAEVLEENDIERIEAKVHTQPDLLLEGKNSDVVLSKERFVYTKDFNDADALHKKGDSVPAAEIEELRDEAEQKAIEKQAVQEEQYYYDDPDSPRTYTVSSEHADIGNEYLSDHGYGGDWYWNGKHFDSSEEALDAIWEKWWGEIGDSIIDEVGVEAAAQAKAKIEEQIEEEGGQIKAAPKAPKAVAPTPQSPTIGSLAMGMAAEYGFNGMTLIPILTKAQEKFNSTSSSQSQGAGKWGDQLTAGLKKAFPSLSEEGVSKIVEKTRAWLNANKPPAPPTPKFHDSYATANYELYLKDAATLREKMAGGLDRRGRNLPPLDMDWEAREERRKKLGFTVKAYKGVNKKDAWIVLRGRTGDTYGAEGERGGFYTNKPKIAEAFGSAAVYPVWLRTAGWKVIDYGGQGYSSHGGNDYQINLAKNEGYTGLWLKNVNDSGGTGDQFIAWNMSDVRSWHARFDESDQFLGDMLAAGVRPLKKELRDDGFTKLRDISKAMKEATAIVQRTAGPVEIVWHEVIPTSMFADSPNTEGLEDTLGGYWLPPGYRGARTPKGLPADAVIGLAYNDPGYDLRTAAGHEAFHHVERALATPDEIAVLMDPRELGRVRETLARAEIGRGVDQVDDIEVRAYAYQRYRRLKEEGAAHPAQGLPAQMARLFERIRQFLRRVHNALRGLGYITIEDIFEKARTGGFAERRAGFAPGQPLLAAQVLQPEAWQEFLKGAPNEEQRQLAEDIIARLPDSVKFRLDMPRGQGDYAVEGSFEAARSLLSLSIAAVDPIGTLHHEEVHALRQLGLFTEAEWQVLAEHAEGIVESGDMREMYGKAYGDRYGANLDEVVVEEAVGEMLGEFRNHGKRYGKKLDALLHEGTRFFRALEKAVHDEGIDTVDDIIARIDSGEIGKRPVKRLPSLLTDEALIKNYEVAWRRYQNSGRQDRTQVDYLHKQLTSRGLELTGRGWVPQRGKQPGSPRTEAAVAYGKKLVGGDPLAAGVRQVQTETAAFKRWFGKSKVVDAEGKPLVVYHGSPSKFDAFDPHASMDSGFYFTEDRAVGESFSKDEDGERIFLAETYLSLQNPKTIDLRGEQQPSQDAMRAMFEKARAEGHDGVKLLNVREFNGPGTQWVAFRPEQIKSATGNRGTFDPNNPSILFSGVKRIEPTSMQGRIDRLVMPPPKRPPEQWAGNINLDKIEDAKDVPALLQSLAQHYDGFIEARGGRISHQRTREMAQMLGLDPAKLAKRRKNMPGMREAEMFAVRSALVAGGQRLYTLAEKAKGGSDADKVALLKERARLGTIAEYVAGETAYAGRLLNQFKMVAGGDKELMKALLDNQGQNLDQFIDMVTGLKDPAKIAGFSNKSLAVKSFDVLMEIWINSLLSGPVTHVTNFTSNALTALWQVPEALVASAISQFTGSGIPLSEAGYRAFGLIQGMSDGAKAAIQAARTEEPTGLTGKVELGHPKAIPNKYGGRIFRAPGTLLLASDEFYKSVNYRAEINARALRQAVAEGLTGNALARRVADLIANPTDRLMRYGRAAAERNTFTNPAGRIARGIQGFVADYPLLRLIVPFIRTPANIVTFAARRTPFALLFKDVQADLSGRNGAQARDEAAARIALGTAVATLAVYAAAAGLMTGGGPDDPKERSLLYATGWQPYSILIGGTYYSFARFEPLAMLLGVATDAYELQEKMTTDEKSKVVPLIVGAITRNLTNKTFLRGLAEMVEVWQDPERYAYEWWKNLSGTLVPTGVAQLARTRDPYLREARTVLDNIKSRIPGLRETLRKRRDVFGDEIKLEGAVGPDILSPVFMSHLQNNPVAVEMLKVGYAPGMPGRSIDNVDLSPEQYEAYAIYAGRATKEFVGKLIAREAYQRLSNDRREDFIKKEVLKARAQARKLVIRDYPDLRAAIQAKRRERAGKAVVE